MESQLKLQIEKLKKDGVKLRDIAKTLNISTCTVSKYVGNGNSELKEKIITLRLQNKSLREICNELKCSKSTVSKWASRVENTQEIKTELEKNHNVSRTDKKIEKRVVEIDRISGSSLYCSKAKRENRRKIREFIIEISGNKCCICGYNTCKRALQFHHVDQLSKKFELSGVGVQKPPQAIKDELKKCVLLCANCHISVHEGIVDTNLLVPIKIDNSVEFPNFIGTRTTIELTEDNIKNEIKWINSKKIKINVQRPSQDLMTDIVIKNVTIKRVLHSEISSILDNYHYLKNSPKPGIDLGFIYDGKIIGCAKVTNPVRQTNISGLCEISRFVLVHNVFNLASRCLSLVIDFVRNNTSYKVIQSFSDNEIHNGTIYKAANFLEFGRTKPTYSYDGISKKVIYERAMMFGLSEGDYAIKFGLNKIKEPSKTKYVYKL